MADTFRIVLAIESESLRHLKNHKTDLAMVASFLTQLGFDVTLQAEYDDGLTKRSTQEMGLEELAAGAPVTWDG